MRKKEGDLMKKKLALFLALVLLTIGFNCDYSAMAVTKKTVLNKKSVQLTVGKVTKVTLKNASKKVKWIVGDKKIVKITKKSGSKKNKITMKGKKIGSTKITAKCGKKKYTVKVKVVPNNVEKEAVVTPQTTKAVVETTKAVPETTKSIEATTKHGGQTTTSDETTTSNEEVTTEDSTTTEETTESEENFQIVAKVLYNKITVDEDLDIEYSVNGNTDKEFYFGEEPGKLEIYEDGVWFELKTNEGIFWKSVAHIITSEYDNVLTVPLNYYYQDIRPGHYRYTHNVSGKDISVYFDVYSSGTQISGTLKYDKIKVGDNLDVSYFMVGKEDKNYDYGMEPGKLEIYEDGIWSELKTNEDIFWNAEAGEVSRRSIGWLNIPLNYYYQNIRPGYYRYTHNFKGSGETIAVSVEFDMYESEE